MSSSASRLMKEEREVASQTHPVVWAVPDENNILLWRAMILGPPLTPYSLGMFHFNMKFPSDYPNSAPSVQITTTDGGRVRFNPNLYASGRVCLSILGTWRAKHPGEQWSAVQSVQSVLLSIQSLMHEAPYHNEPGFEVDDGSGDVLRYNEKIAHETLRVAVCDVMQDTLERRAATSNGVGAAFADSRKQLFLMYFHLYLAEVDRLSQSDTAREKSDFKRMPFESPSNGITGSFQWSVLRSRLTALHAKLMEEVEEWRAWGAAQTQLVQEGWDSSVNSCMHHLRQEEERLRGDGVDGTSIGSEHTNTSVWVATIFGPAETLWDGGMFQVELVFPPNFPDSPPFVRFVTPIFHPHINEQGVPYLRQLITWHCCEPKQRTLHALLHALVSLLATSPSPEPVTHLDARAAALYFSSTDGQKEYNREVKKRVQRSVEM
ncbi:hypothetical protein AB1Y20_004124 [Prymnesium parvum]|uniref:UBC core domain-containing protein n=1 Tax=Prymnesium parvum TaxID=97485 RepID=A0AB34J6R6_PRYPA|mmetsp:Transcript_6841/g.17119  ORF Transcript_6841/g.17119 Transcript_6841/m.17119 type:complete len:434 (-) Transcript_6841:466-1767(-)|eukprot:CAMPEP_0182811582 /NCGR_PEP_ID=MMETSP0006_2-20121128/8348_1 /TAXON_ID=97485 /ORGANISM="Prymnesium parvum, Strain Texoma1" /LENGTH=433 /DNA_ID=CAMNT_0024937551 /DNA_START=217 /DNA_END=1518 /DNA_ORIENTATION=+